MNKKIVGVLVCTLMIIAVFIPTARTIRTLNNNGPTVNITSPADGYETTESFVVMEGTAYSEMPIDEYGYNIIYPDGSTYSESWDLDPPLEYLEFTMDAGIMEGEEGNLITVYAKDVQDNVGSDSVTVYRVGGDTEPPAVIITSPKENMVFYAPDITVTGTGTDNVGVTSMRVIHEWFDDSEDSGPIPFSPPSQEVSFEYPLTLFKGWNKITVYMYDETLNKGFDDVEVVFEVDCTHGTPRLTDSTGKTKFFGVFVGINYDDTDHELAGAENAAKAMYETLKNKPGWSTSRMTKLIGNDANKNDIREAIRKYKDGKDDPPDAQPGDEFLFFFSGHGYNHTKDVGSDKEESDGLDESILAADEMDITDDDLKGMISGFPECVTITVKLDCCHSGGFKDGKKDVQKATDENHKEYGPKKINIEASCGADEESFEDPYYWDDKNGDGIATPNEYERELGMDFDDEDDDGVWDEDEDGGYWNDENNDGKVDPGERVDLDSKKVSFMTKFTKENLKGLTSKDGSQLQFYDFTNADKNMDGITTTRELYEYTINNIYTDRFGDSDGDGLVDEDYGTYEIDGLKKIRRYIDEDADGFLDEDPAPPMSAFWPNDPPYKPSTPIGKINGNPGKTYTYSTSTNDPDDNSHIWYWFDWGDGINSGWVGPYASGATLNASHIWSVKGTYSIKVKAKDVFYAESDWSDPLEVTMPKNKAINNLLFLQRFFQCFPFMGKILNQIT